MAHNSFALELVMISARPAAKTPIKLLAVPTETFTFVTYRVHIRCLARPPLQQKLRGHVSHRALEGVGQGFQGVEEGCVVSHNARGAHV